MFISQGLRSLSRAGGGWVGSRVGQFVEQRAGRGVDGVRVLSLGIHKSAQLGHYPGLGVVAAADGPDLFSIDVQTHFADGASDLGRLDQDGRRRVFVDDDADQAFNYESTQSGRRSMFL